MQGRHERDSREIAEWKFWKGKDAVSVYGGVVWPERLNIFTFAFTQETLPFTIEDFRNLRVSVRSSYSQHGVEVASEDFIKRLATKQLPFNEEVRIVNHGTRPVRLPKGAGLFRLFTDSEEHSIKGEPLTSLVTAGAVHIEGKEGFDWRYKLDERGEAKGVYLRIVPESRLWIPPDYEHTEPIIVESDNDYRKKMEPLLEPVLQRSKPLFWTGETVKVILGPSVEGIIGEAVRIDDNGIVRVSGRHINSRLLDGGKTNWPVRVEIVSPTIEDQIPNYVYLYFVRREPQAGLRS